MTEAFEDVGPERLAAAVSAAVPDAVVAYVQTHPAENNPRSFSADFFAIADRRFVVGRAGHPSAESDAYLVETEEYPSSILLRVSVSQLLVREEPDKAHEVLDPSVRLALTEQLAVWGDNPKFPRNPKDYKGDSDIAAKHAIRITQAAQQILNERP